jgi:hypothetical protein
MKKVLGILAMAGAAMLAACGDSGGGGGSGCVVYL